MINMSYDEFEELVISALDSLPEEILAQLENVDVVIEDEPSEEQIARAEEDTDVLLGLYEGIPHIDRTSYGMVLPDKITIFRLAILSESNSLEEAKKLARDTVLHEIAHHFGITDERLIELDRY